MVGAEGGEGRRRADNATVAGAEIDDELLQASESRSGSIVVEIDLAGGVDGGSGGDIEDAAIDVGRGVQAGIHAAEHEGAGTGFGKADRGSDGGVDGERGGAVLLNDDFAIAGCGQ